MQMMFSTNRTNTVISKIEINKPQKTVVTQDITRKNKDIATPLQSINSLEYVNDFPYSGSATSRVATLHSLPISKNELFIQNNAQFRYGMLGRLQNVSNCTSCDK